jgi:hypothetical protein
VSGPKRHHYVPRVYLERFADDGILFVRWREGRTFTTGAANVAVETGFYDVELEDGSASKEIEEVLADFEGNLATALRSIDESGEAPQRGTWCREVLLVHLALQYTRTPEQRERVLFPKRLSDHLGGRQLTLDLVEEYLTSKHLRFPPGASETQGAFDFAAVALQEPEGLTTRFSIDLMLRSIEPLRLPFDEFDWTVEHDRKGRLITSDTPLVVWRTPSDRDELEGFGAANAEEIRLPLDPTKQLVLARRARPAAKRITTDRVDQCNLDVLATCYQFAVGRPRSGRWIEDAKLRVHHPVLRFDTGPLYERQPDGSEIYQGEVMHMWVPR